MSQNHENTPNLDLLNKLWIDLPKVNNFIGKQQWSFKLPEDFFESSLHSDDIEISIKRNTTFFYTEQKTTFGALRRIYTERAVNALLHDGFVEIIEKKK